MFILSTAYFTKLGGGGRITKKVFRDGLIFVEVV